MSRVSNIHWTKGPNLGDRVCGPARYLWPDAVPEAHVDDGWPHGNVILGGGGLCHPDLSAMVERHLGARRFVVWAVGTNTHGERGAVDYPRWFDRAVAVGVRDWRPTERRWVPCPSCLSPEFDRARRCPVRYPAVGYWHHRRPLPCGEGIEAIPGLTNACPTLRQALEHLASGETVVTNTYHGAYWGALLGRGVVVPDAFSSRFFWLRYAPRICEPAEWRAAADVAQVYPGALEECRAANLGFAAVVEELLGLGEGSP